MKQEIRTPHAQSAPALLSQGLIVHGFMYTAGFIHITADGKMIEGSTEDKFRQVMKNIGEVLKAGGASFDDVVKVTLYVTDIGLLGEINKLYPAYFTKPYPVREAVCVKELPLSAQIEMSVVAVQKVRNEDI